MNQQVKALTKVIGKKEEQLQALRCHQTHMTTTIHQLQADVKKNGEAAAADKAAKTYAAHLQTKVFFFPVCSGFQVQAQLRMSDVASQYHTFDRVNVYRCGSVMCISD